MLLHSLQKIRYIINSARIPRIYTSFLWYICTLGHIQAYWVEITLYRIDLCPCMLHPSCFRELLLQATCLSFLQSMHGAHELRISAAIIYLFRSLFLLHTRLLFNPSFVLSFKFVMDLIVVDLLCWNHIFYSISAHVSLFHVLSNIITFTQCSDNGNLLLVLHRLDIGDQDPHPSQNWIDVGIWGRVRIIPDAPVHMLAANSRPRWSFTPVIWPFGNPWLR